MNVRLILIGMVAGLVLPLAAANARVVFDPGLTQTGAGADLERGTTPSHGLQRSPTSLPVRSE
jgi:hypothetical protein